jgi:hypothetical protein
MATNYISWYHGRSFSGSSLEQFNCKQHFYVQTLYLRSDWIDLLSPYMLILVSKTVLVSVCTPLVAILFSASAQLVSSNLLFCYGGSGMGEVAQHGVRVQIDRTRQAI